MSVTCAQCELAVICEEIRKSVSHLPFLHVLQRAVVPRPHLYMAGPLATLCEPDGLGRNVPEKWPAGGYYAGGFGSASRAPS